MAMVTEDSYPIDKWLLSRLQQHIINTTEALELFQTRQALQEAYFGIESDLKWYRRRLPEGVRGSSVLSDLSTTWMRLLAPFIPFTCENLWKEFGSGGGVAFAEWPEADSSQIDESRELSEELLVRTVEDIESIMKLIQIEPENLTLFIAPEWKKKVFDTVARSTDRKGVMGEIMKDEEMRKHGKAASLTVKQITNLIHRLPPAIVEQLVNSEHDEVLVFESAKGFLKRESGLEVAIVRADESNHPKAGAALPFKPAIVIS